MHLDHCQACQAAAESKLSSSVWSSEILWFPDHSERLTDHSAQQRSSLGETMCGLSAPTRTVRSAQEELGGVTTGATGSIRTLAGRFELRRQIGMGGCGTVFAAWDRVLHREVAVKTPHWQLGESDDVRKRFAKEARAAARLSHPNIVPVYEAHFDDGDDWFLVSELIRGPTLLEWLGRSPVDAVPGLIRSKAAIVAALADGVDFAHSAGVLHRDLKPSNVLLAPTPSGELSFTPQITDFGLARLAESASRTSSEADVCGSLPYMAPEQITGLHRFGPAGDVYSLGVILYEMLTGDVPILAETAAALLTAIPADPVPGIRRHYPEVPRDLEAVCLKCLEKSPLRRYQTAAELAADLRRFLSGERVTARLPGRREQLMRWTRRNPTLAAVLSTLAVAILVVLGVLLDANRRQSRYIGSLQTANQEREESNRQLNSAVRDACLSRQQAESQRGFTLDRLYVSDFRQAMRARADYDLPSVERILDRLDGPEFAPYRGIECEWLRTKQVRPYREVTRLNGPIYSIAFSPDETMLAAAGQESIVRLVNYQDGRSTNEWQTNQLEANAVMFAPDGLTLWTTGDDGSLCQWEVPGGALRQRIQAHVPGKAFNLLQPNESNEMLISIGSDGRASFWDVTNGSQRSSIQLHAAAIAAIDSDPAGRRIYSAGKDHQLRILSLPDRQVLESFDTGINFPITMISLRNGVSVVVSESGPRIRFWHPAKHSIIELHEFRDDVRVLVEHPSEPIVFGIDAAGVVYIIGIPPAEQFPPDALLRLPDRPGPVARLHSGRVYAALISQNQQSLITCGEEGAVRSWSVADLSPSFVSRFADAQQVIRMIGPSYDGKVVFALAEDAVLSINPDDLSIREAMPLTADRSRQSERLLPDNSMLTVEREKNGQHRLVLRKFTDGKTQQDVELGGPDNEPHDIDCDPRLRLIVVGDLRAPHCHFVSMDTFEPLKPLRVRVAPKHIAVSPERSLLAVSQNRQIEVYDLSSRNLIWSQQAPANVSKLKFLDQANCLISVTVDRVIRKWDATSGALQGDMSGHRSSIIELLASRDGRTLISGSHGPEVMFWHVSTCELLGQIAPVENDLASLMLSADEDRLLILDRTKRLRSLSVRP